MNENCIYNVWKEKAYHLSSHATCSHCIFFLQIWSLGGWDHPLKIDRMDSSNLSWWLWQYLPEQKWIQMVSTEQTRCQHFQEVIFPQSSQVWDRTATALFYMVSKKHFTSMIANMSTVLHRDAKGACPRLTQSVSLWSLMTEQCVNCSTGSCTTKAPIHSLTTFPSSTEMLLLLLRSVKLCLVFKMSFIHLSLLTTDRFPSKG